MPKRDLGLEIGTLVAPAGAMEAGTFEIHVGPSAAPASLLKTSVRLVAGGQATR